MYDKGRLLILILVGVLALAGCTNDGKSETISTNTHASASSISAQSAPVSKPAPRQAPPVVFACATARADQIVYLIDRSGSMVDIFDLVRRELIESVEGLSASQEFHIIFFDRGAPVEGPADRMVAAEPKEKKDALDFMNAIRPEGQTDPLPAIARAFDVADKGGDNRTQVIFLLTDGVFPDNEKVLKLIRVRNSGRSVQVHTLLVGSDMRDAIDFLREIAGENRGRFTKVKAEE